MTTDDNGNRFYTSLKEAKPDGYTPIKTVSVLSFFRLKGRTSTLTADNLEPIPDLLYTVHSKAEGRYYVKTYRGYDLSTLYFYKPTWTFSGEDLAVENLRRYVEDGNVSLLMTKAQVEDTATMLTRVYKKELDGVGQLDYTIYLEILHNCLKLEEYESLGKPTGYMTVCKSYKETISDLWRKAYDLVNDKTTIKN